MQRRATSPAAVAVAVPVAIIKVAAAPPVAMRPAPLAVVVLAAAAAVLAAPVVVQAIALAVERHHFQMRAPTNQLLRHEAAQIWESFTRTKTVSTKQTKRGIRPRQKLSTWA